MTKLLTSWRVEVPAEGFPPLCVQQWSPDEAENRSSLTWLDKVCRDTRTFLFSFNPARWSRETQALCNCVYCWKMEISVSLTAALKKSIYLNWGCKMFVLTDATVTMWFMISGNDRFCKNNSWRCDVCSFDLRRNRSVCWDVSLHYDAVCVVF